MQIKSGGLQVTFYRADFRFSPASLSGENLQPSPIDGYGTAIADKIRKDSLNISKDGKLNRPLDSFHWFRPKERRGIPGWNQLTKPPIKPSGKLLLNI